MHLGIQTLIEKVQSQFMEDLKVKKKRGGGGANPGYYFHRTGCFPTVRC